MASQRAIVIGTGAGGLAAAAYLAKDGFEVTALEQAEQLGGYLAPFSRRGFQFDVGVHYVGACRPGQLTHQALAGIGLDATALFTELDPDGFDVFRFPNFEVRRCVGLEPYRERLSALFPGEAQGLRRLFRIFEHVADATELLFVTPERGRAGRLARLRALGTLARWSRWTFADLLGATLRDPHARAVLAGASGDYGLPPSRASALAAMQVFLHYADGAFYPRGGGKGLRDALVKAAQSHGATLRTGAHVAQILIRDDRAVGVELTTGEELPADVVISDANPFSTYSDLLDPQALPASLRRKLRRLKLSPSACALYLGMNRPLRGLGRNNLWTYPTWSVEQAYAPLRAPELDWPPARPALFVSSGSAKDDAGGQVPQGASSLEAVIFAPYAPFARWRDTPVGARGTAYEDLKRSVGALMLAELERQVPGLVGDVAVRELSTPLTNEAYTLAPDGAIYGPAETIEQVGFRRFRTRTPFENLFLVGAGVLSEGIAACLLSGQVAAAAARALVSRQPAVPTYAGD